MALFVPGSASFPSSGVLVVWVIIAMSTSSSSPRRMNSDFPPRNSSLSLLRSPARYSSSMNSSAGTAISATRPLRASSTPAACNPAATPSIMPI